MSVKTGKNLGGHSYLDTQVTCHKALILTALFSHQLVGPYAQCRRELPHRRRVRGAVAILDHGDRVVRDLAALGKLPHRQRVPLS